jgi:hypothetical protein
VAREIRDVNQYFAPSIKRGQDEMKHFVNVLAKQVIERPLVEPLPDIIVSSPIIHQFTNEEVGYIAEES